MYTNLNVQYMKKTFPSKNLPKESVQICARKYQLMQLKQQLAV